MLIKENWQFILDRFMITDPQYSFEYASLLSEPEMFFMEDNENAAFLIFTYDKGSNSFETPYGYGSFWSRTTDEIFINEFFASFHAEMSKRGCVAGLIRFNPFIQAPKTEIFNTEFVRDTVYIDLEEEYSKKFSKRTKGDIKRASSHGLDLKESSDERDFISFFELYSSLMDDKNASEELMFKKDYFLCMSKLKNAFVMLAQNAKESVGGALFIFGENVSYYHLSAVIDKKKHPGLSTLLLHSGIEAIHRRGGKRMMLGGGMTSAKDDPLLFFKEGFSKLKLPFYIGKMVVDENEYRKLTREHDEKHAHSGKLFLRYKYK
ncbi:MAG: peptidoglycan bridge formation glycyltransferase FemA/FemB family protein [bacterium]|nr:peptidoglycan bridge formation glycyltransferase FemA/FemB family protein [bacterium]